MPRGAGAQITPDRSDVDSSLPPGTIEATIVDGSEKPIAGTEVRLGILRQSVAEGNSRDFKVQTTGPDGKVRFAGLEGSSKFSYRITTKKDLAEYASSPISLSEKGGQSVLIHVYPVTSDIQRAQIGMRGVVVVDPRDDAFQIEVLIQVFNVGAVTWVPDGVMMELPRNYRAFNTEESMNDTQFTEEPERGARMEGTFSPGQHELIFRFQVPSEETESAEFVISMPPHVAELRVMAPAGRNTRLDVQGFDEAQPTVGQDGRKLLVVVRQLRPGEPEMHDVTIRLSGIPTPGSGRWIAVGLALTVALSGLFWGTRTTKDDSQALLRDAQRAEKLLLKELVDLERARASGQIGPRTYSDARRALLDALTRVEVRMPKKPPRPRRRFARAR